MLNFKPAESQLIPVAMTVFILLVTSGCSSVKMGDIDETMDHRDDMSGPGIFSDDTGQSKLSWNSKSQESIDEATDVNKVKKEDLNEFELYKDWKKLETEGKNSAEYQEFLQWLEFQKLKAAQ